MVAKMNPHMVSDTASRCSCPRSPRSQYAASATAHSSPAATPTGSRLSPDQTWATMTRPITVSPMASQMRLSTAVLRANRSHSATITGARNARSVPIPTFNREIVRKYRYWTRVNATTP